MSAITEERRAFAATLEAAGPDAPTLAGSWTTADVGAHVVALDRLAGVPTFVGRALVGRGIRLNDVAGGLADRSIAAVRRKGWPWTLDQLRAPPPPLLLRPSVAAVGLFEVFVHHEDVLRARDPAEQRATPPGLAAVVPWLLRYHRRPLRGVRLRAEVEDWQEVVVGDGPDVVVRGPLAEVVLWLAGRHDVARVEVSGDAAAVARATGATVV